MSPGMSKQSGIQKALRSQMTFIRIKLISIDYELERQRQDINM